MVAEQWELEEKLAKEDDDNECVSEDTEDIEDEGEDTEEGIEEEFEGGEEGAEGSLAARMLLCLRGGTWSRERD